MNPSRNQATCHKCNNPSCVNPRHLWVGSFADNVADMMAKKRHRGAPGTKNGMAKLTEKQVRFIRKSRATQHKLAKQLGVTQGCISMIRLGKTWRHLWK